ncbi:hypothetical protein [Segatella oulorum]|uniref:hypothetical protein n=1 Tax=Segatella oulorum TaxID=28136 RepID=UPI0023F28A98|nr:hypothetical protein [Segatella oulorum]
MNNGNVLSQRDCCSNRVCILNRILRRRGFVCNDSTKAFKIVEVIKKSEAWFKKIREGMYQVLSLQVYLNRTGLNKDIFEVNQGRDLKGKMILEVPVQKKPIPQNVINYADKLRIKIRNTNNKLYN